MFIRNGGNYFLTDLLIYADGLIDCWGLVTVEEFAEKLRSGWVATTFEDGARASAHHVAAWKFAEVQSWTTPEELLGEVGDEIDRLNGRPDSTGRCLATVTVFRAEPSEEQRAVLREAYLAIPEHLRRYALGDMDSKDWPLKVLAAGPGARLLGGGPVVTDEMYQHALEYFAERDQARTSRRTPPRGRSGRGARACHRTGPGRLSQRLAGRSRRPGPAQRIPGTDRDRRGGVPDRQPRLLGPVHHG
ncbi:hypothetical protein ACIQOV_23765 [Kitasatospora sp. NPDC091257]|uniref:DUF7639 domain-containing protein n=1 Tax=Kitasatospora sp. NPDC091257 TaxID=3364084 RepID=UPI00381858EA